MFRMDEMASPTSSDPSRVSLGSDDVANPRTFYAIPDLLAGPSWARPKTEKEGKSVGNSCAGIIWDNL